MAVAGGGSPHSPTTCQGRGPLDPHRRTSLAGNRRSSWPWSPTTPTVPRARKGEVGLGRAAAATNLPGIIDADRGLDDSNSSHRRHRRRPQPGVRAPRGDVGPALGAGRRRRRLRTGPHRGAPGRDIRRGNGTVRRLPRPRAAGQPGARAGRPGRRDPRHAQARRRPDHPSYGRRTRRGGQARASLVLRRTDWQSLGICDELISVTNSDDPPRPMWRRSARRSTTPCCALAANPTIDEATGIARRPAHPGCLTPRP